MTLTLWGLIGGAVGLLVLCAAVFVWGWYYGRTHPTLGGFLGKALTEAEKIASEASKKKPSGG